MATEGEIYPALTTIFQDIFLRDDLTLSPETSAKDVAGWDSFKQIEHRAGTTHRIGLHHHEGFLRIVVFTMPFFFVRIYSPTNRRAPSLAAWRAMKLSGRFHLAAKRDNSSATCRSSRSLFGCRRPMTIAITPPRRTGPAAGAGQARPGRPSRR